MSTVVMTKEACEICTEAQLRAVYNIMYSSRVHGVHVQRGGFDLPEGYLAFRTDYRDGGSIYGGIAPNGDVST